MNAQRRKQLEAIGKRINVIATSLEDPAADLIPGQIEALEVIGVDLENLRDEEQEYLDNMPEGLQMSTKGDMAQEAIDATESAESSVESAHDELQEDDPDYPAVIEYLEAAVSSIEDAVSC